MRLTCNHCQTFSALLSKPAFFRYLAFFKARAPILRLILFSFRSYEVPCEDPSVSVALALYYIPLHFPSFQIVPWIAKGLCLICSSGILLLSNLKICSSYWKNIISEYSDFLFWVYFAGVWKFERIFFFLTSSLFFFPFSLKMKFLQTAIM